MAEKTLVDEIAKAMLENLAENNENPEAYWGAKTEAQSGVNESIVPRARGPQDVSFLSKKTGKV